MDAEAEAEADAMRLADASMNDPFSIFDRLDGVTDGVQNTKDVRSSALWENVRYGLACVDLYTVS